ncbi:hypothetical protein FRC14_007491 [Serendipita sp. 396]|nr:hypothetical protein FRC14_007491 [Serendipita sp. 396]
MKRLFSRMPLHYPSEFRHWRQGRWFGELGRILENTKGIECLRSTTHRAGPSSLLADIQTATVRTIYWLGCGTRCVHPFSPTTERIKQERRQFPNLLPIVSSTPVSHQRPSANAPRGFQDRIIRSQVTRLSLLYPTDAFWGTSVHSLSRGSPLADGIPLQSAELTSPIDWLPENALEKIPEAKNREQTVEEPKDLGRGIEEVAEICGLGELETRTRASLLAEERVYYFLWDLDKQAKGVESNAGYTVPFPLGPNCVSPYHTHTHICLRG